MKSARKNTAEDANRFIGRAPLLDDDTRLDFLNPWLVIIYAESRFI